MVSFNAYLFKAPPAFEFLQSHILIVKYSLLFMVGTAGQALIQAVNGHELSVKAGEEGQYNWRALLQIAKR